MRQSCHKLLKTKGDKISTFRLSTMFMKIDELYVFFHDIDENKDSY
jgi:hypothetical protein